MSELLRLCGSEISEVHGDEAGRLLKFAESTCREMPITGFSTLYISQYYIVESLKRLLRGASTCTPQQPLTCLFVGVCWWDFAVRFENSDM